MDQKTAQIWGTITISVLVMALFVACLGVALPATPATGLLFIVKDCKGDANTNNITVSPAAGNIDGSATYVMNANHQSASFFYDGTQWEVF